MEKTDIAGQRRAYLSLWTDFVMDGGARPGARFGVMERKPETVKYMVSAAGTGDGRLEDDARAVYESLCPGMDAGEVRDALDDYILEDGDLLDITEPGLCRIYFQIGRNVQFWAEFSWTDGQWYLLRKSPLEAKGVWYRYAGNRISLPLTEE